MSKPKIAFLCDIDNTHITVEAFNNVLETFRKDYDIVTGKVYGYADRKHRPFIESVRDNCFEIASVMRFKKRVSQMDIRILVDAVDLAQRDYLDGFLIIGGEGDFVPLLTYLKGHGKFVAGWFRNEANYLFCDAVAEIEEEQRGWAAKKAADKPAAVRKPAARPAVTAQPAAAAPAPEEKPVTRPAPAAAPQTTAAPAAEQPAPAAEQSVGDIFSELEKIVKEFKNN